MSLVVDLSSFNTVTDWNKLKASVSGVILRCAYRGYGKTGNIAADKKFSQFATACKSNCIPFGIYFMSQAITEHEAIEEAQYTINAAKQYGATLPLFIDSEWSNGNHNGRADYLSKAARTAITKAFCNTIKSAGYVAGVYASESWFNSNLNYNELKNYYIWVAKYGKNTGVKDTTIKLAKYDLHQYTSNGVINGISGRCDVSVAASTGGSNTVTVSLPVLKKGSKSTEVGTLQRLLKSMGFKGNNNKDLSIDNDYGNNTLIAVKSYQSSKGLSVDGVVGANTWTKLLKG